MSLPFIGDLVRGVAQGADELFTSDEERLKLAIEEKRIDADLLQGQMNVNAVEATHKSVFVAGWRPAIGWIGAIALAYQFVLYPLLGWVWLLLQANNIIPADLSVPPVLPTDALYSIILGMLGIGGMRSLDKRAGKETNSIRGKR
tara:strand:- start:392 stop:826 length:435 start_codon:yes stop_codon:yes gene_type:complete